MSNNKQSSVEWLEECLSIHFTHEQKMQFEGLFQQAKAMHKEQTLEFIYSAVGKILDEDIQNPFNLEQYYIEKYGS